MLNVFKKKNKVTWYCDSCDATLNKQHGFKTKYVAWICEKCGYLNDVTDKNILSTEKTNIIINSHKKCIKCGGHMFLQKLSTGEKWWK